MRLSILMVFIPLCVHVSAEPLEVVRTVPHSGWSEGLDYHEGYLWHALPKQILKLDPKDGGVVERFSPASDYSESVVWLAGGLWNLSFSDNGIYRGELKGGKLTFAKRGETPEVHGWGLATDGKHLIMTGNYSPRIYFLDAKSLKLVRTLTVSVSDLEDLAWDGEWLWTSSFTSHRGTIFRIHPKTGELMSAHSLPKPEECPIIDGIAYDGSHLWLTGKNCLSIFRVKRPDTRSIASQSKSSKKDKKKKP